MTRDGNARRLRLNRQTLRTLGAPALARVAGGTEAEAVEADRICPFDTLPKTNGWSRFDADAYCIRQGG